MRYRISVVVLIMLTHLVANDRHQMNIYTNVSRAGYTPGLAYLYLFGKNFGLELGAYYGLGESTVNVEYDVYGVNLLLTHTNSIDKDQTLVLKLGPAYREYQLTYTTSTSTVVNQEIYYYNYGFDYLYKVKEFGTIGLSYFADSFGVVYRIAF